GPGARGVSDLSSVGSNYAVKVAGASVTKGDFHFAYMAMTHGGAVSPEAARANGIREKLMDKLIERELFADEAERLGFQVSEEEAAKMIIDGRLILIGVPRRMNDDPFFSEVYKNGHFDREKFKLLAQNRLGVTEKQFVDIQRRELLA